MELPHVLRWSTPSIQLHHFLNRQNHHVLSAITYFRRSLIYCFVSINDLVKEEAQWQIDLAIEEISSYRSRLGTYSKVKISNKKINSFKSEFILYLGVFVKIVFSAFIGTEV
jgi:hypothetical protein